MATRARAGAEPRSPRRGRDVGFGLVFTLTVLCAGEQPGTEGPACQHQLLGACGAEPGDCVDRVEDPPPPGTQGLFMAPSLKPFTWISCDPHESLMSPLRCLLSVSS